MAFYSCFNYRQIKTIHHSYLSSVRQSPRSQTSSLNSFFAVVERPPISRKVKGWALCSLAAHESCPKCLHVPHHLIHRQIRKMIYENQGSKKETMWKTEHTASFMQNICHEDEREERKKERGGCRSESVKKKKKKKEKKNPHTLLLGQLWDKIHHGKCHLC